jgi:hypothetical protein
MNRYVRVRTTNGAASLHPSLQNISVRTPNQLEKPFVPAEPKKVEAPVKQHKEEKKGKGLSVDKKQKVLEFLEFNL